MATPIATNLSWQYFRVPADTQFTNALGQLQALPANTLVRIYTGTFPADVTLGKAYQSPTNGSYIFEIYPADGEFWQVYPADLSSKISSAAWDEDTPARLYRLGHASGIDGLRDLDTSDASDAQLDAIGVPVSSGGPGPGVARPAGTAPGGGGSGLGWLVAAGIVAKLLHLF